MELKDWGFELTYNRDHPELGSGWEVYVEEFNGTLHKRYSHENKPHKEALRNAKAALRRLCADFDTKSLARSCVA
jgi:hypothetical protein